MQNFISPVIIHKFPDLLKTEYRAFYRFLCDYFNFLEEYGNPLDVLERFYYNCESNNEELVFIDLLLSELGFGVNKPFTIPKSELILHLREFFLNRGNVRSFIFLFKVLFGETPEIDYPRKRLFVLSDATYSEKNYIYTLVHSFGTLSYYKIMQSSHFDLKVTGLVSGTTKNIESILLEYHNNVPYLKIQIDDKFIQFFEGEAVKIENTLDGVYIIENIVNVVDIEIKNGGFGYSPGDSINISGCKIDGKVRVKSVTDGSIQDVSIISGGQLYSVGDRVYSSAYQSGFSGSVTSVDLSQYYMKTPHNNSLQLKSSNFTLELFVERFRDNIEECLVSKANTETSGWSFGFSSDNNIQFSYTNVNVYKSRMKVLKNTLIHIAIVRNGQEMKFFINGIPEYSISIQNGLLSNSDLFLGNDYLSRFPFSGKVKGLTITKIVKYASKFIPSLISYDTDVYKPNIVLCFENDFTEKTGKSFTTNLGIFSENSWCVFSGYGPIRAIELNCGGYNINKVPTLSVSSKKGTGANIQVTKTDIGSIKDILIDEVYGFAENKSSVVISCESLGQGAQFIPKFSSVFIGKKDFRTTRGFLGSHCNLLDSHYYQQFSYEIKSSTPKSDYDLFVDDFLHPAGFIRFTNHIFQIDDALELLLESIDAEVIIIKVIQDTVDHFLDISVGIDESTSKQIMNNSLIFNNINNIDWEKNFESFSHKTSVFENIAVPDLDNSIMYISEASDVEITI